MEKEFIIYHNPRCRKSRETLQLLEDAGVTPTIIKYLETPPDAATLKVLCQKLGIRPAELVRKGEALYKSEYKGKTFTDAEWLDILAQHPQLIERPIVVREARAAIGRPPENVSTLM